MQKKSAGLEAIPNYEFWVDVPNLIKDGATFCMSCVTNKGGSTSFTETAPENTDGADAFSGDGGASTGKTKYDQI